MIISYDVFLKFDIRVGTVAAVVNFPEKQIEPFMSQCLVLGFSDKDNKTILAGPDQGVPNGGRLH